MSLNQKIATVFGGTGFIGRQIVRELAARGVIVKVVTRVPEHAYFLKLYGAVGQIVPLACDYEDSAAIEQAVAGSDYVVNCLGILYERGQKRTFDKLHVDYPVSIATAAHKAGVSRLVHISALGCDKSASQYAQSKLAGEQAVAKVFPGVTILRPSVVFGADDDFFNRFARMARNLPFLPLIGGGETKFQPVYVGDVADAVMAALLRSDVGLETPTGHVYELGGPEVLSFKEIYERLFEYIGYSTALLPLSFAFAKFQAIFLQYLPKPPLTPDQVDSLKADNVVSKNALGFKDLGISPTSMSLILPRYLSLYRPGGRFGSGAA